MHQSFSPSVCLVYGSPMPVGPLGQIVIATVSVSAAATAAVVAVDVAIGSLDADGQVIDTAETTAPAAPGLTVQRVVDGDTVVLSNGRRVRLIGIDTPEQGDCGATKATEFLSRRVEGKRVKVENPASVQNRDAYERDLRYLARRGSDPGLQLIEAGLAVARYDSKDGYDRHPRQARYRAADRASEDWCERLERRGERLQAARRDARDAGLTPRPDESARELRSRTRAARQRQRAREQRRIVPEAADAAVPDPPSAPPSSSGFTPPPGWTTDRLTPGYTGCRQGYPGGYVSGVYVWKPIPC